MADFTSPSEDVKKLIERRNQAERAAKANEDLVAENKERLARREDYIRKQAEEAAKFKSDAAEKLKKLAEDNEALKKRYIAAGADPKKVEALEKKEKVAAGDSAAESSPLWFNEAATGPVPERFFFASLAVLIVAVIGVVALLISFPDLIVPVLTGFLLWVALLVIWQFVMHFAGKALWKKSRTAVHMLTLVPFITLAILTLVFLATALHEALSGPLVAKLACYPDKNGGDPVPPFSPDAVPKSALGSLRSVLWRTHIQRLQSSTAARHSRMAFSGYVSSGERQSRRPTASRGIVVVASAAVTVAVVFLT